MSDIIKLSETLRLVVIVDEDAEDPQTWSDGDESEAHERWVNGEVYTVYLEEATEYARIVRGTDGSVDHVVYEDTMQRWEVTDSLSGCYLDDNYTPLDVASAYFNVSHESLVAAGLKA